MARKKIWTDDQLRAAVAASRNYRMVATRLGLKVNAPSDGWRRRIRELALDTKHFAGKRGHRMTRWTDEQLRAAIAASHSVAGALRVLGLVPAGGNYDHVRRRISELAIDTSHFLGQGWNVGLKFRPNPTVPLDEVLVANRWVGSHRLKKRLFRAGLKFPLCELCGWAERSPDGRLPLELDHRNGDKNDNRIENLRILCPNCHALQPTHRGLNQQRRKR